MQSKSSTSERSRINSSNFLLSSAPSERTLKFSATNEPNQNTHTRHPPPAQGHHKNGIQNESKRKRTERRNEKREKHFPKHIFIQWLLSSLHMNCGCKNKHINIYSQPIFCGGQWGRWRRKKSHNKRRQNTTLTSTLAALRTENGTNKIMSNGHHERRRKRINSQTKKKIG